MSLSLFLNSSVPFVSREEREQELSLWAVLSDLLRGSVCVSVALAVSHARHFSPLSPFWNCSLFAFVFETMHPN